MGAGKSFDPVPARTKGEMRGEDFRNSRIYALEGMHLDARRKKIGSVSGTADFSCQDFWSNEPSVEADEASSPKIMPQQWSRI